MIRLADSDCAAPARAAAGAQLVLAMLLAAIAPMFVLERPIQTHSVKLDLPPLPAEAALPDPAPSGVYNMTSLILAPVFDVHDGMHRLELTPADEVLIDGVAVDLVGLRQRLDMIAVSTSAWVDFRPHAHARYELFAEVLAVLKRARIERLRLDGRAFVHAIDRHG